MIGRVSRFLLAAVLVPSVALAQAPVRTPQRRPVAKAPVSFARFALAPTGNEVRFVVHEQLMTMDLPSDAIGTTRAITGGIVLAPSGQVDPAGSRITIAMDSLRTDQEHRDSWIKSHTLRTDSFPTAVLVVRELQGLPKTLPTSGTMALKLVGDLTVHGVTRPWTWDVTLTANGSDYSGKATTHLKFGDFGMEPPHLMIVVSVVDDVKLEYDFHFLKQDIPPPIRSAQ
jgi:polyisoprenoid-binding protein YceI